MTQPKSLQKSEEVIVSDLRRLFRQYGYRQYKMNKFEEYDLYVENKRFLVSDSVLTFTDLDGHLRALKPDVTLSIAKNCAADTDTVQKLFYQENVNIGRLCRLVWRPSERLTSTPPARQ